VDPTATRAENPPAFGPAVPRSVRGAAPTPTGSPVRRSPDAVPGATPVRPRRLP